MLGKKTSMKAVVDCLKEKQGPPSKRRKKETKSLSFNISKDSPALRCDGIHSRFERALKLMDDILMDLKTKESCSKSSNRQSNCYKSHSGAFVVLIMKKIDGYSNSANENGTIDDSLDKHQCKQYVDIWQEACTVMKHSVVEIPLEKLNNVNWKDPIGMGSFGKVFRGTWLGTDVAVKQHENEAISGCGYRFVKMADKVALSQITRFGVGSRKSEVGTQKSELRSRNSEVGSRKWPFSAIVGRVYQNPLHAILVPRAPRFRSSPEKALVAAI
ncbi:hypothetical protein QZH41_007972 [Actinostola sp. cb2023]|nr:hypothetical protein QZH41_007972 [Actinostola sp. cb2023]